MGAVEAKHVVRCDEPARGFMYPSKQGLSWHHDTVADPADRRRRCPDLHRKRTFGDASV